MFLNTCYDEKSQKKIKKISEIFLGVTRQVQKQVFSADFVCFSCTYDLLEAFTAHSEVSYQAKSPKMRMHLLASVSIEKTSLPGVGLLNLMGFKAIWFAVF